MPATGSSGRPAARRTSSASASDDGGVVGDQRRARGPRPAARRAAPPAPPRCRGPGRRSARPAPGRPGAVASAVATDSRRCWPPERVNGLASASAARPSRSSSSSARRRGRRRRRTPERSGPSASSSRTRPVRNWCSGCWKTVPMRRTSVVGRPAVRRPRGPAQPGGERRRGGRPGRSVGAAQPGQQQREGGLARAVRPGDGQRAARPAGRRRWAAAPGRRLPRWVKPAPLGREQELAARRAGARAGRRSGAGAPAGPCSPRAAGGAARRPGRPGAATPRRRGRRRRSVVAAVGDDAGHGGAHQRRAVRVELRGRLVEQQQPGPAGQRPGQHQPLLLPAGERGGGAVAAVREADRGQRAVDRRPDPVRAACRRSPARTRRRRRRGS